MKEEFSTHIKISNLDWQFSVQRPKEGALLQVSSQPRLLFSVQTGDPLVEKLVEVEPVPGEELKAGSLAGEVMIDAGKGARADKEIVGTSLILVRLEAWQLLEYRETNLRDDCRQWRAGQLLVALLHVVKQAVLHILPWVWVQGGELAVECDERSRGNLILDYWKQLFKIICSYFTHSF